VSIALGPEHSSVIDGVTYSLPSYAAFYDLESGHASQDVLNITDDADDTQRHEERKGGSCDEAGVLGQPQQVCAL